MDISSNLSRIRLSMAKACQAAGRDAKEVRLLAVSKTRDVPSVSRAINAGQQDFGENYLQEAIPKVTALPNANWHFIGAIQSNKTRDIASHFHWVHSAPSFKVARRLSEQRPSAFPPINLLFQVNVSGEASKSGVLPEETAALVAEARTLSGIRLRGLMAIPEADLSASGSRSAFRQLRNLRDEISATLSLDEFDQLSMGMSADFEMAIEEGATWIRVGTGIFGPRETAGADRSMNEQ